MATYTKTGTESLTQEEMPVYGLSRVGAYQKGNTRYVYELTDHLGNLRALITEDGGDAGTEPDILSYKDYYAFGMEMPGRSLTPDAYKFGYQGLYAELDQETGLNSFWLRSYDARIGQFSTTDPYNYGFSSYNGMDNDPVSYVDPTGGIPLRDWLKGVWNRLFSHKSGVLNRVHGHGSYAPQGSGGGLLYNMNSSSSNSNESTGGNSGHYKGGGSGTGSSSPKTDHDGYPCTSKTGWGWDVTPAPHDNTGNSDDMTMSNNGGNASDDELPVYGMSFHEEKMKFIIDNAPEVEENSDSYDPPKWWPWTKQNKTIRRTKRHSKNNAKNSQLFKCVGKYVKRIYTVPKTQPHRRSYSGNEHNRMTIAIDIQFGNFVLFYLRIGPPFENSEGFEDPVIKGWFHFWVNINKLETY